MEKSGKIRKTATVKLERLASWIDETLEVKSCSDVSNNGVQIARRGADVARVAFGVDASVSFMESAAAMGAQLAVVHHGISWGGGIARIDGGVYNVVKAAMDADIALYAVHLPLDAHHSLGHNWTIARRLGLVNLKPAFAYHGVTIGVVGDLPRGRALADIPELPALGNASALVGGRQIRSVGVCSGGAGCFAADAKALGCDIYITGEADWGERIAAENCGMPMLCAGHYETETFGIRALAAAMKRKFGLETCFIPRG